MNELHYKGDVRTALTTAGILGPSDDGRYHRVESAAYDAETDRTTAHLTEVD